MMNMQSSAIPLESLLNIHKCQMKSNINQTFFVPFHILEATWISEGGSSQSKGGKGPHFCLQICVMPGDATFATSWLI